MPDYPDLGDFTVVPFGPGYVTIGQQEFDTDVALALYPLNGPGESIASIELISFDRAAALDITPRVLVELTAHDCRLMGAKLLLLAAADPAEPPVQACRECGGTDGEHNPEVHQAERYAQQYEQHERDLDDDDGRDRLYNPNHEGARDYDEEEDPETHRLDQLISDRLAQDPTHAAEWDEIGRLLREGLTNA